MIRDSERDQRAERFLAGRPRQYKDTSPAALQEQMNGLADMLVVVVKERDQFIKAASAGESAKMWTRILTVCVCTEGLLIGWLATQLFERLGK